MQSSIENSQKLLQTLSEAVQSCKACDLCKTPGLPVPGIGFINPMLMIVGEGPGKTEAEKGRPFVGASGQLLQEILSKLNFTTNDIYITNIVKHRPPNNRVPTNQEQLSCIDLFLRDEIQLVQPTLVVATGRTATYALHALSNASSFSTRWCDQIFYVNNTPVYSTWHPAYILRNKDLLPKYRDQLLAAKSIARGIRCSS